MKAREPPRIPRENRTAELYLVDDASYPKEGNRMHFLYYSI